MGIPAAACRRALACTRSWLGLAVRPQSTCNVDRLVVDGDLPDLRHCAALLSKVLRDQVRDLPQLCECFGCCQLDSRVAKDEINTYHRESSRAMDDTLLRLPGMKVMFLREWYATYV